MCFGHFSSCFPTQPRAIQHPGLGASGLVVVQTAINWFTDNYAKLAEWAASANRVASLLLALDETDAPGPG